MITTDEICIWRPLGEHVYAKIRKSNAGSVPRELIDHVEKGLRLDRITLEADDFTDFDTLAPLVKHATSLDIWTKCVDWKKICKFDGLKTLTLADGLKPHIPDLTRMPQLSRLAMGWFDEIECLFHLTPNLKSLSLEKIRSANLPDMSSMQSIEFIGISSSRKLESLLGVGLLRQLKVLSLYGNTALRNISDVTHCYGLEVFNAEANKKIENFETLAQNKLLKELLLEGSAKDILWLKQLPDLRSLRFNLVLENGDIGCLVELENIQEILFKDRRNFSHKRKDILQALTDRGIDSSSYQSSLKKNFYDFG